VIIGRRRREADPILDRPLCFIGGYRFLHLDQGGPTFRRCCGLAWAGSLRYRGAGVWPGAQLCVYGLLLLHQYQRVGNGVPAAFARGWVVAAGVVLGRGWACAVLATMAMIVRATTRMAKTIALSDWRVILTPLLVDWLIGCLALDYAMDFHAGDTDGGDLENF